MGLRGVILRGMIAEDLKISDGQLARLLKIRKESPDSIELIDKGILSINQAYLLTQRNEKEIKSRTTLNENWNVKSNTEDFNFYQKYSIDMNEVQDGEIDLILTSPPFYKLRSYTNNDSLGNEESPDVNHYYCPLSERRFNMSIEMSLECDMKRCLNIPTTEDFLWKSLITTLKDNKHLSKDSKTLLKSDIVDFRNIIGQQLDDIESRLIMLEQRKEKIKKSLVEVEKRQLYGEYDGSEVYESLKKSLNKDLDDVSVEVDHLVGLKKVDSDHKKWYNNYKSIVNYICGIESWEEDLKREFLRLILHRIDLSYNHTDQTHDLNTILKIPLHNSTTKSGNRSSTPMVIKHLKTSVNTGKSTPISAAYSTVMG